MADDTSTTRGRQATRSGRYRTLWPLPGGSGSYIPTLLIFLDMARKRPSVEEFIDEIGYRFPGVSSRKAARSYLGVVSNLGFIKIEKDRVRLTRSGLHLADTPVRTSVLPCDLGSD